MNTNMHSDTHVYTEEYGHTYTHTVTQYMHCFSAHVLQCSSGTITSLQDNCRFFLDISSKKNHHLKKSLHLRDLITGQLYIPFLIFGLKPLKNDPLVTLGYLSCHSQVSYHSAASLGKPNLHPTTCKGGVTFQSLSFKLK